MNLRTRLLCGKLFTISNKGLYVFIYENILSVKRYSQGFSKDNDQNQLVPSVFESLMFNSGLLFYV